MSKQRILLLDDSELMLEIAGSALTEAGFDVTTAADLSILDEVEAGRAFELILMDVQMPELYGDDIASVLRHGRGVRTPIYLFSDLPADELEERTRDAQLDGFLRKSDGTEALVERVTAILAARGPQ